MDKEALKQFLIAANEAGYASGKQRNWIKEPDGSTTITFKKGPWKSHDNFFGGEPYGGRTIVFYQKKPFWIMVYYGWIEKGTEPNPIYEVLRKALIQMPKDYPFRGPREYKEGVFAYTNIWQGQINSFSGREQITQEGKLVYQARYLGGLVDQRKGT